MYYALKKNIISYRFLFARFPSRDVRIFHSGLRVRNFNSLPANTIFWSYFPDEISLVIPFHPCPSVSPLLCLTYISLLPSISIPLFFSTSPISLFHQLSSKHTNGIFSAAIISLTMRIELCTASV